MNRVLLLFLMISFSLFSQVQIGDDIDGELTIAGDHSGRAISFSSDGTVVAIGALRNDGNGNSSGHVRIYKNISGVWTQIGNDIDGEAADDFSGISVSLSSNGTIVAIGAEGNDGNGNSSGHVRIYRNISNVWTQIGDDIDGEAADDFSGISVSLSSDGTIVAIGAPGNDGNGNSSGHVRIYRNISDVWTQVGGDIDGEAADDNSGISVSLSSDGTVVAVGATGNDGNGNSSGHVRIYRNIAHFWPQVGSDIDGEAADDNSGISVSLSSDGKVVAIGATGNDSNGVDSGHVRIYRNNSDVWTQVGSDIDGEAAGDFSGISVSLSSDGTVVAIGANLNDGNGFTSGHVRNYTNISDVWTQVGGDIDGGEPIGGGSGVRVSLSSDGSVVAISARANNGSGAQAGHVRVLENILGVWIQIGDDIDGEAAGDASGNSISLSSDGTVVAIGALGNDGNGNSSGHVRIYKNISDVWTQIGDDIDGEVAGDRFGESVSLSSDGNIIAIGGIANDDNGSASGHVRVFENISGVWTQVGEDIDGEATGDFSGRSLSLSSDGTVVAIGADGNDGNGNSSGHVRIYRNISGVWTQIGDDINGEGEGDRFGSALGISSDGSIVAVGAYLNDGNGEDSGHVRIYRNISGVWTQIGNDIDGEAAEDYLGRRVSLSSDGNIVAIGATGNDGNGENSGHVRIYTNTSDVWTQIGNDIDGEASEDLSGSGVSLSVDGSIVAIGAPGNDGNALDSGHVRVYDLSAVLSTQSFEKDYFSYYPNPVNDVLNIQLNKGIELKQVNLYNLQGQHLYSVKTSKIDVSHLSSGMYFIEVETNQGKSAKKIIID